MTKSTRTHWIPSTSIVWVTLVGTYVPRTLAAPGDIANLGTLGGPSSTAWGVNAAGQVTGTSDTTDRGPVDEHAFLYTGTPGRGGAMFDLDAGGGASVGYGINVLGQVTGAGHAGPFVYTGTPGHGGALAYLGTSNGVSPYRPQAINASGQLAGMASITGDGSDHAFLYTGTPGSGGVAYNLGTLGGGPASRAFGINDLGQVTGYGTVPVGGNLEPHAFLYTGTPGSGGAMADLGIGSGQAINNAGQVVGTGPTGHAFLYTGTPGSGGAMHDLGTLPGDTESDAYAINAGGQIVGYSAVAGRRDAFLYVGTPGADGHMIDLNAWLRATNPTEGARWTLTEAHGISDNGLIVGEGTYDDGPGGGLSDGARAFLLDASSLAPEPSALMLFAATGSLLARRRRRTA